MGPVVGLATVGSGMPSVAVGDAARPGLGLASAAAAPTPLVMLEAAPDELAPLLELAVGDGVDGLADAE